MSTGSRAPSAFLVPSLVLWLAAGALVTPACVQPGPARPAEDLLPAPLFRQPGMATTTDSEIAIKGYAQPNLTIEVYVNGVQVGTAYSDLNGEFELSGIPLSMGRNLIRAVAVDPMGRRSPDNVTATTSPATAGSQLKTEIRITRK